MGVERLTPYTLTVPEGVFPLGEDALRLGEFATVKPGWQVCDLGTGSGALLLLLARREKKLTLTGVEREEVSARCASDNLRQNGLNGEALWDDFRNTTLSAGKFDLVISNPPYFSTDCGKSGGPFRSEEFCTLEELCAAAGRLVKNGGRFALCHRPERLAQLFDCVKAAGMEPKRLQFCAHSPAHAPYLLLLECIRQGRPGLSVLPTIYKEG